MDLKKPARRGSGGARLRLLSMGVVVALVAAGCGGSSTPTTTTKKPAAKKTANTTTVSKPVSVTMTAPSTSTKAAASTGTPTFASVGNCSSLAGVGEQFEKAMSSASSGGKFNLNAMVKAYQNLANAAPSSIRPDIQELAGAFSAYASALGKAGYKLGSVPNASQISAIESATKLFTSSKMKSAETGLETWATANCK
jgi:hypothetical protein